MVPGLLAQVIVSGFGGTLVTEKWSEVRRSQSRWKDLVSNHNLDIIAAFQASTEYAVWRKCAFHQPRRRCMAGQGNPLRHALGERSRKDEAQE